MKDIIRHYLSLPILAAGVVLALPAILMVSLYLAVKGQRSVNIRIRNTYPKWWERIDPALSNSANEEEATS